MVIGAGAGAGAEAQGGEVSWRLRVTAPKSFAEQVIPALIQAFQKVHPEIEFDVDFALQPRDLVADAFDVGFRSVQHQDGYLVARPPRCASAPPNVGDFFPGVARIAEPTSRCLNVRSRRRWRPWDKRKPHR